MPLVLCHLFRMLLILWKFRKGLFPVLLSNNPETKLWTFYTTECTLPLSNVACYQQTLQTWPESPQPCRYTPSCSPVKLLNLCFSGCLQTDLWVSWEYGEEGSAQWQEARYGGFGSLSDPGQLPCGPEQSDTLLNPWISEDVICFRLHHWCPGTFPSFCREMKPCIFKSRMWNWEQIVDLANRGSHYTVHYTGMAGACISLSIRQQRRKACLHIPSKVIVMPRGHDKRRQAA